MISLNIAEVACALNCFFFFEIYLNKIHFRPNLFIKYEYCQCFDGLAYTACFP